MIYIFIMAIEYFLLDSISNSFVYSKLSATMQEFIIHALPSFIFLFVLAASSSTETLDRNFLL